MDFSQNPICQLFQIQYPIIQAGMIWVSGGDLALAASKAGALGLIGAGSMKPELLKVHIRKVFKESSEQRVGVNIPLLYSGAVDQIETALEEGVKIFFTSAGSPKKFTRKIKDAGGIVVHVVSSPLLAQKCEDAGVDAIVAEGFEAGGHNGREEITTMSLIPQVRDQVSIPLIAAGGIAGGRQMAASFCLGADAVQIGSRFAATVESSAHENFKKAIVKSKFSETKLMMKKSVPVRLLQNEFAAKVKALEDKGASKEELEELLGKGRAKKGMLEGDLENGELEIGQVSGMISEVITAREVVENAISEYQKTILSLA